MILIHTKIRTALEAKRSKSQSPKMKIWNVAVANRQKGLSLVHRVRKKAVKGTDTTQKALGSNAHRTGP